MEPHISPIELSEIYYTLSFDSRYMNQDGFHYDQFCFMTDEIKELPVMFLYEVDKNVKFKYQVGSEYVYIPYDDNNHDVLTRIMAMISCLWEYTWFESREIRRHDLGHRIDLRDAEFLDSVVGTLTHGYTAISDFNEHKWIVYDIPYVSLADAIDFMQTEYDPSHDYSENSIAFCRRFGFDSFPIV